MCGGNALFMAEEGHYIGKTWRAVAMHGGGFLRFNVAHTFIPF